MISFSINVNNLASLDALAKAVTPAQFQGAVLAGMRSGFYLVHQHLPPYPAPPPNSSYVRTGKLGQTITEEVATVGNDVSGMIGSDIEYAPYVIGGDDEQAWMHQGRWWQLENVVEKDLDLIIDEIAQSIEAYLATV